MNKKSLKRLKLSYLFYLLIFVFVLNFGFFLTDFIADKEINWESIIYSPISNETWLLFWGNFSASLATILLLLHYKNQLNYEKNKYIYEYKIKSIKEEKTIILNLLNGYETSDIETFIEILDSNNLNVIENLIRFKRSKTKELNLKMLEVDFLTSIRLKDEDVLFSNKELRDENMTQNKLYCYNSISNIHSFYKMLFEDAYKKSYRFWQEKTRFPKEYLNNPVEFQHKIFKSKDFIYIDFINNNKAFLKKSFSKVAKEYQLLMDNNSIYSQYLEYFNFSEEEILKIKNFLVENYINFSCDDFEKINFDKLFTPEMYAIILNSYFTEVLNYLTNYYGLLENKLKKSFKETK